MGRERARSYQVTPFVRTPEFLCVMDAGPRLDRSYERHAIGQEISGSQPRDGIQKPSSLETSDTEPQARRRAGAARPVRGVRATSLHGRGSAPFHSTMRVTPPPTSTGGPSCGPGCVSSPLIGRTGVATGSQDGPPCQLAGQQQTHPLAVAGEGLRVPQRRKKKRLTGIGVAVGAMSPIRPNVIWAIEI